MELNKKTTVLFSDDLHRQLTNLARTEGKSLGQLVREACRIQYGLTTREEKLIALQKLKSLNAPVDSVEVMKRQSVPDPKLLP
tara:strand:- start:231 stop:479 length:249 start_codon:yes stop_codon:yes gene_type:complete